MLSSVENDGQSDITLFWKVYDQVSNEGHHVKCINWDKKTLKFSSEIVAN